MEPRQSGRADGRGWSGRGDSRLRRGEQRRDRAPGHATDDDPTRATRAGSREGLGQEDNRLHGPEESPWVRFSDSGAPPGARPASEHEGPPLPDLSSLLVLLEGLRGMVPREVSTQLNALLREILLTLRALIDWYLERLDGPPSEPEVEEIPIE